MKKFSEFCKIFFMRKKKEQKRRKIYPFVVVRFRPGAAPVVAAKAKTYKQAVLLLRKFTYSGRWTAHYFGIAENPGGHDRKTPKPESVSEKLLKAVDTQPKNQK